MTFDKIYFKTTNTNLELILYNSSENNGIFFNGGGFIVKDNVNTKELKGFKELSKCNSLIEIRENMDFDFYLLFDNNEIMKISYKPNDSYINGVEQVFEFYNNKNIMYNEILDDFNNSKTMYKV